MHRDSVHGIPSVRHSAGIFVYFRTYDLPSKLACFKFPLNSLESRIENNSDEFRSIHVHNQNFLPSLQSVQYMSVETELYRIYFLDFLQNIFV
jgi:hypothetical protein